MYIVCTKYIFLKVQTHHDMIINLFYDIAAISVESNQVLGLEVPDFWRVRVGLKFDLGRQTWVWKGSKFSFSRFGSGLGPFLAEHVRILGFLEQFE